MCPVEFSGFDELQRHLKEIQEALSGMEGTIAQVKFNPRDPESVEAAVREMEAEIDRRVAGRASNSTVRGLVGQMKQRYAEGIRQRAREALARQNEAKPPEA